ncbi:hypothetical protein P8452_08354 [Trifolium repens]|nr:hypothetical protein P8452_08354 [Trifolium repens]
MKSRKFLYSESLPHANAVNLETMKLPSGSLIEIGTDFATLLCFLHSSLIHRVFSYLHYRSKGCSSSKLDGTEHVAVVKLTI